jgi:hypothetical protein
MKREKITTFLICAAAVSLAFPFEFEIMHAQLYPTDIIFCALVVLLAIRFYREPEYRNDKPPHLLLFLAFLLFSIPSRIPLIEIKGILQGTWTLFRNLIEVVPLFYLLLVMSNGREERWKKVVVSLLIATSFSSLIGIAQTVTGGKLLTGVGVYGNLKYLGIFPPYPSQSQALARENIGRATVITHVPRTKIFRAHGGLSRHNYFGAFLVLTTSLSMSLSFFTQKKIFYLFAVLQAAALVLTYSRAAMLGILLSLAIIFCLEKPRPRKVVIIALLMAVLIGNLILLSIQTTDGLIAGLADRWGTLINPQGKATVELEARWRLWGLALHGVFDSPRHFFFGHGRGGVEGFEFLGYRLSAHNDVLDIIYTRGILSFIAVAWLGFFILRDALRLFKREGSTFVRAYGLGAFTGLLGLLLTGMAQSVLDVRDTGALLWFVFGITVVLLKATRGYDQ